MSKERYILIDSTYRDRNEWKNPAQFELISKSLFNQDERVYNMLDPVSDISAVLTFTPFGTQSGNINIASTLSNGNIDTNFIVTFAENTMSKVTGYYNGSEIVNTTKSVSSIILGWEYITNDGALDYFRVTTSSKIFYFNDADAITIDDATDVTTSTTEYLYFIPTGIPADNWYTDTYILWNDDKQEGTRIINYDAFHKLATVDATGLSWAITDQVVVRKEAPKILDVFPLGSTTTTLILSASSSNVNNFYKNMYIRIPSESIPSTDPYVNQTRRIISYNGTTKEAVVEFPFVTAPPAGAQYEIFPPTKDNFSSFNYVGSNVSSQEMVCYEIRLINLTLPNQPLEEGSRIAFYPYVLVEFQNVSSSGAGLHNIIYSNNPNANRKLFRAAIDDVNNPVTSPFIKVDGDSMTQTIKFKPNDNLKFGVYLPNGKIFDTILNDTISPNEPNPLLQISALFSIKRIV